MAARGSTKRNSVEQEEMVARRYNGVRSRSSGAADHDAGDVRTEEYLIECKMTGRPGYPQKSLPKFVQDLEKVADEAYADNRDPMLALRYYAPDSILADSEGWVDLIVRLLDDDATRDATARWMAENNPVV